MRKGPPGETSFYDVCVVGSGPAGLAAALSCEAKGLSTVVLEAGGPRPTSVRSPDPILLKDEGSHATLDLTTREAVGGTSWAWGGLCVPFARMDFEQRDWVAGSGWPMPYEDFERWVAEAADFIDCGLPFEDQSGTAGEAMPYVMRIGRLARRPAMAPRYADRINNSTLLEVCHDVRVTSLVCSPDGNRIASVEVVDVGGRRSRVRARRYVLACGGLRTTRLLLQLARDWPRHFAAGRAPLGRYYMGHITGEIATVTFDDPSTADRFLYLKERPAYRYQRRLQLSDALQRSEQLLDAAFTLRSPPPSDSRHRDGVASLMVLLSAPPIVNRFVPSTRLRKAAKQLAWSDLPGHLRNVVESPWATLTHGIDVLLQSRVSHLPVMIPNSAGRYSLRYHAEQMPNPESRVYLGDCYDDATTPQMIVDFKYTARDIQSVVRSHELLDQALRTRGKGRLDYLGDVADRGISVQAQALDGYHQVGTTRMGLDPAESVVDSDCCVHGLPNMFIASSSVFPTTGSANPTFSTVALSLRLANHIAECAARERISHTVNTVNAVDG
jgi:choline dehydrogenase-like flavoprotein